MSHPEGSPAPAGSRSDAFGSGVESVRAPASHTISPLQYKRTSVLDAAPPTNNGYGTNDAQRRLYGAPGSGIGESQSTFDQSLWMRKDTNKGLLPQPQMGLPSG